MNLETLSAPLEIKLAGGTDTGEFEGYGSFFGNVDSHGDVVAAGAFKSSLVDRAARGLPHVPMHFNHGIAELGGERAVGVWAGMSEDSKGLHVRGRLSGMNTDRGRYYFERVKDGAIGGLSIGYRYAPNGVLNGDGKTKPLRTPTSVHLHEVSIVDEASNALARVQAVKLAGIGDLESLLRRGGLSKKAARQVATRGWPALSGDEPESSETLPLGDLMKALDRHALDLKGLIR